MRRQRRMRSRVLSGFRIKGEFNEVPTSFNLLVNLQNCTCFFLGVSKSL